MLNMIVRPAHLNDYESVMAISNNIYEGFDYLCSWYQTYLQDKDCYSFVGEIDEKIVAFVVLHVLDNGTSVLGEAGRVARQLQNKGLMAEMYLYALPYVLQRVPTLAIFLHVSLDTPALDNNIKKCLESRTSERIVLRYHCLAYRDNIHAVENRIRESRHLQAYENLSRAITMDGMMDLLQNAQNVLNMFPSGYFTAYHNGTTYRAWSKNILDVTSRHATFVTDQSPGVISAISFGYATQVVFGTRYDIYYYGDGDSKTLLSHVITHIKRAVAICSPNKNLGILLQFSKSCDLTAAKTALFPYLGLNLQSYSFAREGAYVFESPLPPIRNLWGPKL